METENTEKTPISQEGQTKPLFYRKELIVVGLLIAVLTALFTLLTLIYKGPAAEGQIVMDQADASKSIVYDKNIIPYTLIFSAADGLLLTLATLFGKFLGEEKPNLKKVSYWVIYAILFLLGLVAYLVITVGLMSVGLSFLVSILVANLIFSLYLYLMAKMYFYDYISDKRIFYEIIRFCLVGVIAAIFDFATCYLFEFYVLKSLTNEALKEFIYVTAGFIVGVTINYLCSVYMVFKATTSKDTSRTALGRFMFVFLAAIGLLIGYGINYLLINLGHVGFVLTFIIRTLIVLVWNYFSRKYLIFK
jgi:putative flippase GtrA